MDAITTPVLQGVTKWHDEIAYPNCLIVMLHGFNSTAEIFSKIGDQYSPHLKSAYFFIPNGPVEAENGGFHWFDFKGLDGDSIYQGIEDACVQVNQTVDHYLEELRLTDREVFFVGFSQGASIALHAGLMRRNPIAGILSFSGQIIQPDRLRVSVNAHPPVCLIHGRDDTAVPIDKMADAMSFLMRDGTAVDNHPCDGLGHNLNKEALIHGLQFLSSHVPEPVS